MVHNMRNDYRGGRRVLHCVVDAGLHDRVRAAAVADGVSITLFVSRVLGEVTGYGVGVESGDFGVFGAAGSVHGQNSTGVGGGSVVVCSSGRGVDWDSVLARGEKQSVAAVEVDPIEEYWRRGGW